MDKDLPHVSAANFKTNCLRLMDEVAQRRVPLVITKRGRAVARLVPARRTPATSLHGSVSVRGDIVRPILDAWDADE